MACGKGVRIVSHCVIFTSPLNICFTFKPIVIAPAAQTANYVPWLIAAATVVFHCFSSLHLELAFIACFQRSDCFSLPAKGIPTRIDNDG